jgi:hypothetical protein
MSDATVPRYSPSPEPALTDLSLTPRQIAERDVKALGPDEASAKWASLWVHSRPSTRLQDIVNAVLARCYEVAPPSDKRRVFVVSFVNRHDDPVEDVLVFDAPTPFIAMMGGMRVMHERGTVQLGHKNHIRVTRIDDTISLPKPPAPRDAGRGARR